MTDTDAVRTALAYVSAGFVGLSGVAHALPTRRVVQGFNDTSHDNQLVVTQEWIAGAMTMWFISTVVFISTAIGTDESLVAWVYRTAAAMLLALAALTAVTGARTAVVSFKICPVLLSVSAALLLAASTS